MAKDAVILSPVRGDVLASLEDWKAERDMIVASAKEVASVASQRDLDRAGEIYTLARKHIKALEAERKKVTGPIDAVKKQIMAQEKELAAAIEAESARVKALCDAYATEQARLAEESRLARAEADAEAERARQIFGVGAVHEAAVERIEAPKASANRLVERWSFEITDPAAVPREFCSPDEQKIRAWLSATTKLGSAPSLPGVEFTKTVSVESK